MTTNLPTCVCVRKVYRSGRCLHCHCRIGRSSLATSMRICSARHELQARCVDQKLCRAVETKGQVAVTSGCIPPIAASTWRLGELESWQGSVTEQRTRDRCADELRLYAKAVADLWVLTRPLQRGIHPATQHSFSTFVELPTRGSACLLRKLAKLWRRPQLPSACDLRHSRAGQNSDIPRVLPPRSTVGRTGSSNLSRLRHRQSIDLSHISGNTRAYLRSTRGDPRRPADPHGERGRVAMLVAGTARSHQCSERCRTTTHRQPSQCLTLAIVRTPKPPLHDDLRRQAHPSAKDAVEGHTPARTLRVTCDPCGSPAWQLT